MTMLDGLKPVFLEALHFADERTRAALVEKWNLECQAVYEYKKQLIAEEHYKAAHNKSEWVSVEERLPEDVYGGDRKIITVLVCTKSGRVSTASRVRMMRPNLVTMQYEYTDIFEWSGQIAKKVTHWMPLPEAPKGGEE